MVLGYSYMVLYCFDILTQKERLTLQHSHGQHRSGFLKDLAQQDGQNDSKDWNSSRSCPAWAIKTSVQQMQQVENANVQYQKSILSTVPAKYQRFKPSALRAKTWIIRKTQISMTKAQKLPWRANSRLMSLRTYMYCLFCPIPGMWSTLTTMM